MTSISYRQVSNADTDGDIHDINLIDEFGLPSDLDIDDESSFNESYMHKLPSSSSAISSKTNAPITKLPVKHRDTLYGGLFIVHVLLVTLLSFIEKNSLESSILMYGKVAGSWSSLLMIVTLLGSCAGTVISLLMNSSDMRERALQLGLLFAIIFQACLGNILLLIKSRFSWLGILFLLRALYDSFWYKVSRESISLTSALIQLVINVCRNYGTSLTIGCIVIVAVQTCTLLWWGVLFVGIISNTSAVYSEILILVMILSLWWITQFFHALASYIIGGCVMWYFVKAPNDELEASKRVLLHVQAGLTMSFGTLCKGALVCPFAQPILAANHYCKGRPNTIVSRWSVKGLLSRIVSPFVSTAQRHNRLAFCLAATYGLTLSKAAEDYALAHPQTMDILIEDLTGHVLGAASIGIAGILSLFFGMFADKHQGAAWPLFFFVSFQLSLCGLSLVVQTYCSAVDALTVVFALEPLKFAAENQIIYLRFLRATETALR